MKKIIYLLGICLLTGCSDNVVLQLSNVYSITVDNIQSQDGTTSLLKDSNGMFHLKLVNSNNKQQLHRVVGRLLINGKAPYPQESVQFDSNLYWVLPAGSVVASIVKAYPNYHTGQFSTITFPPLITRIDELVPTSNSASYSSSIDGTINNIIAPILEMKGDTLILKASHYKSKTVIFTKIILE